MQTRYRNSEMKYLSTDLFNLGSNISNKKGRGGYRDHGLQTKHGSFIYGPFKLAATDWAWEKHM